VFSARGGILAVSGERGTVRLRNALTGWPVGRPIATHHTVTGLALSPDGRTLAVTAGGLQLWSTATGQRIGGPLTAGAAGAAGPAGGPGPAGGAGAAAGPAAFSPDGRLVAAIGPDGKARLWNVATRRQAGPAVAVLIPGGPATAVAFSPDGRTLATADGDGTARLFDVATQQEIGTPMAAGPGPLYAVAFRQDGRRLATAGHDGTARSWDVAFPAGLLAGACAIAGQSLTREQWAGYAGTQPFQQVCPAS
jgi:WD40 repeat protein